MMINKLVDFFADQESVSRTGFGLSFALLFVFALLNVAVTYYHSGHFGILSGVVPDNNSILAWLLFIIYPLVIDIPVMVTGLTLITVGFLGLSNKLGRSVRIVNVGFMLLSCVANYMSIYYTSNNFWGSFAGVISPFSLWVLSELSFALVSEFVMKNKLIQSIGELENEQKELKQLVNTLAQQRNTLSTEEQRLNQLKEYATKEKAKIANEIETLNNKKDTLEKHVQILNNESEILKADKLQLKNDVANIKAWFVNMAASKSHVKSKKLNTEKRRMETLKALAKERDINWTTMKQDDNVFKGRVNMNGVF
jgi:hypothetical protein